MLNRFVGTYFTPQFSLTFLRTEDGQALISSECRGKIKNSNNPDWGMGAVAEVEVSN